MKKGLVARTFLSAGAGDFPVALPSDCVGNAGQECPANPQTGMSAPPAGAENECRPLLHRRDFLKRSAAALGLLPLAGSSLAAVEPPASPFAQRGYYITFMRMPTYGLAQWKQILDDIHADGGNLLLLWMGGAFRSKRFPITWKFNEEHENVRRDFTRELIAHAHTRGLKVLL